MKTLLDTLFTPTAELPTKNFFSADTSFEVNCVLGMIILAGIVVVIPDFDINTFNSSFSLAPILYPSTTDSGETAELVSL